MGAGNRLIFSLGIRKMVFGPFGMRYAPVGRGIQMKMLYGLQPRTSPSSRTSLWPRLHYTRLHWSVAILIPDSAAVYTTPQ
jgi:hypothetical protein